MNASDYDAVIFNYEVYCIECLPAGVDVESDEVQPIFADSEWDYIPSCCVCGKSHDYVSVIS